MKKLLLWGFGAVLVSHIVSAQDTAGDFSSVPSPMAPYIARTAQRSAWTIDFLPNQNAPSPVTPTAPGAPPQSAKLLPKQWKQQAWTKSGSLLKCVNQWSDGSTTEDWIIGSIRLGREPGEKGIHIYSPDIDPRYHDFRNSDFAMLDWMTPKDYVQVVKHGDDVCYLFTAKNVVTTPVGSGATNKSLAAINAPKSATSVFISVQSGLPLELDNGDGKYIYHYLSAPAEELKLPEPYLNLYKAYRAR